MKFIDAENRQQKIDIHLYPVFYIATLLASPGVTHWNSTYRPKYDLCKYNFTVRVVSLRNSLPTHVITAVSVDSFKNRLDKFWANEEARFDYKANLSGTGFVWEKNCQCSSDIKLLSTPST